MDRARENMCPCPQPTSNQRRGEVWALTVVNGRVVSASVDDTMRVWNPDNDWECEHTLVEHGGPVYALTQLEGGKLVSGSNDRSCKVWSREWECERTLECSAVWTLAVCNGRVVSGSVDGTITVWA